MEKCKHRNIERGYLSSSAHADKQIKLGKHQKFCNNCKKWVWIDDYYCNIIHRKPKANMVRVKAWAWINTEKELIGATVHVCGSKIPCTILIDRKYLKEKK